MSRGRPRRRRWCERGKDRRRMQCVHVELLVAVLYTPYACSRPFMIYCIHKRCNLRSFPPKAACHARCKIACSQPSRLLLPRAQSRVRSECMWCRCIQLAVVAACAVSLPGASAEAPWTLTRGLLTVEEVPTGNAWQTRSYLLSDLASKRAAVRACSARSCAACQWPTHQRCRPQLVDCGGNASGAFAAAARQGVTVVALLQTHAVRRHCHREMRQSSRTRAWCSTLITS